MNFLNPRLASQKKKDFFPCVVARHQSVLIRKLGDSDPRLQKQKVVNLTVAAKKLNNLIILPGQIFSFWHIVGSPVRRRGFTEGMLLSNGRVVEGVGGGLCQMSNLLFWLMLHTPMEIVERHHHSLDVFPDSGRVLPFGSGSTIFYNFGDLQMKNISAQPLQLKIWLTKTHLKGQIVSPVHFAVKYHLFEKNHYFISYEGRYFRFNEIWRTEIEEGKTLKEEKCLSNFAPVLYPIDEDSIRNAHHQLLKF